MATHSSTLAWKIPWREPGGLQSMGSQESDTTERLHLLKGMGIGNMIFSHMEMSLGWKCSDLRTVFCRPGAMSPQAPPGGAHIRHFQNV